MEGNLGNLMKADHNLILVEQGLGLSLVKLPFKEKFDLPRMVPMMSEPFKLYFLSENDPTLNFQQNLYSDSRENLPSYFL